MCHSGSMAVAAVLIEFLRLCSAEVSYTLYSFCASCLETVAHKCTYSQKVMTRIRRDCELRGISFRSDGEQVHSTCVPREMQAV